MASSKTLPAPSLPNEDEYPATYSIVNAFLNHERFFTLIPFSAKDEPAILRDLQFGPDYAIARTFKATGQALGEADLYSHFGMRVCFWNDEAVTSVQLRTELEGVASREKVASMVDIQIQIWDDEAEHGDDEAKTMLEYIAGR